MDVGAWVAGGFCPLANPLNQLGDLPGGAVSLVEFEGPWADACSIRESERTTTSNRAAPINGRYVRSVVIIKPKRYDRGVPISPSLKTLSANLRLIRAARGLTQERVAEMAGLSIRHYQEIEAFDRPGLQIATVDRLARALKTTTSSLLTPARG